MAIGLSWVLVKVKEAVKSWTESFQGRSALEDLCPCLCSRERDLIFKSSPEKDNGEKEPAWKRRRGSAEEVGGQIIKCVRLLATSSNLKELINAASEASGSANQPANPCWATPTPSGGWREGTGALRGHDWENRLRNSRSLHKPLQRVATRDGSICNMVNKGPYMKASALSDALVWTPAINKHQERGEEKGAGAKHGEMRKSEGGNDEAGKRDEREQ